MAVSDTQAQAVLLAEAGRRLREEATAHMKSARFHRRRAREIHENLQELRTQCERLGIELHLDVNLPPMPEGGTSGHDNPEAQV